MHLPRFRIRTMMVLVAIVALELALVNFLADMIANSYANLRYPFAAGFLVFLHVLICGMRYLDTLLSRRYSRQGEDERPSV